MADQAQSPKPSRIVRFTLVASLALNLIVAGVLAGSVLSGRQGPPRSFDIGLGPVAQALPRDARRAIGDQIRNMPGLRPPTRRNREAAVQNIVAALRADPFVPDELGAALAGELRNAQVLQQTAQEALAAYISEMSTDERLQFADDLERALRQRPSQPPRRRDN